MSNWMVEEVRAYVAEVGATRPNSAWILSDFDTWEKNPYYEGPPCLASNHPEDDLDVEVYDAFYALHKDCKGRKCSKGFGDPVYGPTYEPWNAGRPASEEDDLPF